MPIAVTRRKAGDRPWNRPPAGKFTCSAGKFLSPSGKSIAPATNLTVVINWRELVVCPEALWEKIRFERGEFAPQRTRTIVSIVASATTPFSFLELKS